MDVLNKRLAQLVERYRALTPVGRTVSALLLVLVVVCLGYLFQAQASGGDLYLLGGQSFTSSELPGMEAAFAKSGLAGYQVDGGRIRIPRGQQAAYMGALADAGALPANFNSYFDEALKDDSPWTSPRQREERLKIAKQQELALIVRSMQGIEKAAVHYDAKKTSTFAQDALVTCSVSVKPVGSQPLDPKQVPMIRDLVAGAIAGLSKDHITVVDLNGQTYSGGTSGELPAVGNDPYLLRMKEYQAAYESRIAGALSYVRGVSVTVNVELNKELRSVRSEHIIDPKNSSVKRARQETITTRSERPSGSHTPALLSDEGEPGRRVSASAADAVTTEEHQTSETQNVVGSQETEVQLAALTPNRVTAAVGVPSSYFVEVWRQRNPAVAGRPQRQMEPAELEQIEHDEKEKIRAHVASILPPLAEPADHALPLVTVTTFQSFTPETIPEPTTGEQIVDWLKQSWSTLGMFGLAIVGLVVLRSVARSATSPSGQLPAPTPADLAPHRAEKSTTATRRIDSQSPLPAPHAELADAVREDPRAAASVLSDWIGNAS